MIDDLLSLPDLVLALCAGFLVLGAILHHLSLVLHSMDYSPENFAQLSVLLTVRNALLGWIGLAVLGIAALCWAWVADAPGLTGSLVVLYDAAGTLVRTLTVAVPLALVLAALTAHLHVRARRARTLPLTTEESIA